MSQEIFPIYEMFTSIDGEINLWHQGRPSFFIRMAGCNQKCLYCDTAITQTRLMGKDRTTTEIMNEFVASKARKITITGGEPLLQDLTALITAFLGYNISIETNGTVECNERWLGYSNVSFIIDIKLPSSGVDERDIKWDWIVDMKFYPNTWFKFVISNIKDFNRACELINEFELPNEKCAFSPAMSSEGIGIKPITLFELMLEKNLAGSILNMQIHKMINLK